MGETFIAKQTIQNTVYDVATVKLGEAWMIPSQAEWEALKTGCDWAPVTNEENTVTGYNISKSIDGVKVGEIFLPVGIYASSTITGSTTVVSFKVDATIANCGIIGEQSRVTPVMIRPITSLNNNVAKLDTPTGINWAISNLGATESDLTGDKYAFGLVDKDSSDGTWTNYMCAENECGTVSDPLLQPYQTYKVALENKFLDYAGLKKYDELIKAYINKRTPSNPTNVYTYKGSVASLEVLRQKVDNNEIIPSNGDVYNTTLTGMNYAWNADEAQWDALGAEFYHVEEIEGGKFIVVFNGEDVNEQNEHNQYYCDAFRLMKPTITFPSVVTGASTNATITFTVTGPSGAFLSYNYESASTTVTSAENVADPNDTTSASGTTSISIALPVSREREYTDYYVKVYAKKNGQTKISSAKFTTYRQLSAPVISGSNSNAFVNTVSITKNSKDSSVTGVVIYKTSGSTTPSKVTANKYTQSWDITSTNTYSAIATATGWVDSDKTTTTITPKALVKPTLQITSESYSKYDKSCVVKITNPNINPTDGNSPLGTIYFTTDGSTPTAESTAETSASKTITLSASTTIKAVIKASGYNTNGSSPVETLSVTLNVLPIYWDVVTGDVEPPTTINGVEALRMVEKPAANPALPISINIDDAFTKLSLDRSTGYRIIVAINKSLGTPVFKDKSGFTNAYKESTVGNLYHVYISDATPATFAPGSELHLNKA